MKSTAIDATPTQPEPAAAPTPDRPGALLADAQNQILRQIANSAEMRTRTLIDGSRESVYHYQGSLQAYRHAGAMLFVSATDMDAAERLGSAAGAEGSDHPIYGEVPTY